MRHNPFFSLPSIYRPAVCIMRVLGVDPGFGRMGWGVVESGAMANRLTAIDWGVIETPADLRIGERLQLLHKELTRILNQFQPEHAIMEKLFWSQSKTTAAGVFQAQGVLLAVLAGQGLHPLEMAPTRIKQGVAGSGRASKQDVELMVRRLLGIGEPIRPDDAADALAAAIVGWQELRLRLVHTSSQSKYSSAKKSGTSLAELEP